MQKNKTIIHRFEAVVYPYRIWVAFTDNIESLNDNLMEYPSEKPFVIPIDKKLGGFTTMAVDKEGYIGSLIVYVTKKDCTIKTIAHEATHAARDFWEYINEDVAGVEADAYLVGWIADCIYKAKIA